MEKCSNKSELVLSCIFHENISTGFMIAGLSKTEVCVCVFVGVSICLCVCLSVCLSVNKISSRTDQSILLSDCLTNWLWPYWNWCPRVKGQGHSDVISIFSWFSVTFPSVDLSTMMIKLILSPWYALDLYSNFIEMEWVMTYLWLY